MSEADEKRYSAKEIADGISRASIAWQIAKGPEYEEVIDEFCIMFLAGFLTEIPITDDGGTDNRGAAQEQQPNRRDSGGTDDRSEEGRRCIW